MTHLTANWPAPHHIKALTTTRAPGKSLGFYAQNNLGLHVGDDESRVLHNRARLIDTFNLPNEPAWLDQTHSTDCVVIENEPQRIADAAVTRSTLHPLAIMTADCLPILLCDTKGTEIAAIHAGWKGLLNGIIQNTLKKMLSNPAHLMAWIGPAICQQCYEIGDEVRNLYTERYPFTHSAFKQTASGIHANLPQLAEFILNHFGVNNVYQSKACTFERKNDFYSYRREAQTGRMATLIWFK